MSFYRIVKYIIACMKEKLASGIYYIMMLLFKVYVARKEKSLSNDLLVCCIFVLCMFSFAQ